ncbi:metallophosphoesterase family protein [Sphingopyxis terrae]|nr:metallophosphoesterase family protein [Sphingopyxis terrae]PCF91884.1 serine/threonine protein phosphatase [Sphingopyxis terrae subsp. ummariensis]
MFWKRSKKSVVTSRGAHSIPAGRRVYAIGDIHGRDDLFAQLIDLIRADIRQRPDAEITLILLGDLVDRGPDSANVIARAMRLRDEFSDTRLLIGNHEECFLAALTGDVRKLRYFMRIGGDATVRSYWDDGLSLDEASFEEVAERLPRLVPADHVAYLGQGEDIVEIGDYVFVHAGIRPGVPLERQALSDLRWIRDEFLDSMNDHGKMIVHGHSITHAPDEQANRIGIDIGAFQSGALAAVALEGESRWFLVAREAQARADAA